MGIDDYQPSWMEYGGDLSGGAESDPEVDYYEQSYPRGSTVHAAEWETQTTSNQNQSPDDIRPGTSCVGTAGDPPGSGTFVLGSVDGTCQWIDTTDCGA